MPLADTSQNTRAIKLRGRVLGNFHIANPFSQICGPRGTTPSGVLTEKRISDGILDLPIDTALPIFSIVSGNKSASASTSGLTKIDVTDLDDGFIPLPIPGSMVFNFFGTNYSSNINWDSNNALIFGSTFTPHRVSISANSAKSILIGNYDRRCNSLYYVNSVSDTSSITTLVVIFNNYYTDPPSPLYTYQIRLIRESGGAQRQFVEVSIISSPPSPGYSSNPLVSYPSGTQGGLPQDSDGFLIDHTKASPYNISNGTAFLNPCGSTFSTASPAAGTSFVFSSDSTGSNWAFTNNAYVNV